jgi:membrane fusion protein
LLRYQAYPYQKFGHATGRVSSVSRVALSLNEAVGNQHGNNGDPVYLVTVALDRQTITAYGRTQPLQAGMRVDADVLQEKRSLFEWVMEPLYSLSGKL